MYNQPLPDDDRIGFPLADFSQTLDLLQRFRAGDRDALEALLARDLEWIRGYVHRNLGGKLRQVNDTEDIVQEAALAVLRHGPSFVLSSREQFRALLGKIIVNLLRSKHRLQFALKRDPGRERPLGASTQIDLDRPVRSVTRPEAAAVRAEEREWLRMAVLMLDHKDQEVLDLHWQGLTDAEIATRLGATDNTVRMRRSRATERLTRVLLQLKRGKVGALLAEA